MKKPVFGVLSLVWPFFGFIDYFIALRLFAHAVSQQSGQPGSGHSMLLHTLVFDILPATTPLCGMFFAIVAHVRREPYPALRWTGFVFNLGIMLLGFLVLGFTPVSH